MNEIAIKQDMTAIVESKFKKAMKLFLSIETFDDIERVFLKGAGLSANTYRSYLASAHQFYDFTDGLHPLQVEPRHIEDWFDDMTKRVDRNTAILRISGLKAFFRGIERTLPECSPFREMPEKLLKKMSKPKRKDLDALTDKELLDLLAYLEQDTTPKGKMEYAAIFFLATSGLRASEAISLTWGDFYFTDKTGDYCRFIQKGGDEAKQEVYPLAKQALLEAFRAIHNRKPEKDEGLFWNTYGKPMTYHTLWRRVVSVGDRAVSAGLVRGDILFTPHLLRRTYATVLHDLGMSVKAVQGKTRHKSTATLTEHYLKNKEAATPYLDRLFGNVED